jgi:peptidoglycan hydrolase-like protein with peptidoglycan-binding domain
MRAVMRRLFAGVIGIVATATMATLVTAGTAGAATSPAGNAPVTNHPAWTGAWPTVWPGNSGARVVTVQYLLQNRGYRLRADGRYGSATTRAVRSFQRSRGLRATGYVASSTWNRLIATVRRGSRGSAVRAVQWSMRYVYGFHYQRVNGYFGIETWRVVRAFQRGSRLAVDGVVGFSTWKTIVWYE